MNPAELILFIYYNGEIPPPDPDGRVFAAQNGIANSQHPRSHSAHIAAKRPD